MKELIKNQIKKCYEEILFIRFVFAFVNCLSLVFIFFVMSSLMRWDVGNNELYIKFVSMAAGLFTPYLTIVSQGYLYPRSRNINVLRYLLYQPTLDDTDKKIIYGTK